MKLWHVLIIVLIVVAAFLAWRKWGKSLTA